jgi:hypothetical protein
MMRARATVTIVSHVAVILGVLLMAGCSGSGMSRSEPSAQQRAKAGQPEIDTEEQPPSQTSLSVTHSFASGAAVRTGRVNGQTCVELTAARGQVEDWDCANVQKINEGRELLIYQDCNHGQGIETDFGLVPAAVVRVRFTKADGSSVVVPVAGGSMAVQRHLSTSSVGFSAVAWLSRHGQILARQRYPHGVPGGCPSR